jgi:hypothetical protein
MEANELRVGNLIETPYGFSKIDEVGLKDGNGYVKIKNKNMGYYLEVCSPIQLTDEILLKCGFEKVDEYYFLNGYWASFDADFPLCFGNDGCCQREIIKQNIKHLHQLQNLYFALTGEELQITL